MILNLSDCPWSGCAEQVFGCLVTAIWGHHNHNALLLLCTTLCALHYVHYTALHSTSPYGSTRRKGTPQPQRNTHVTAIWGHNHNLLVRLYFTTYIHNTLVTAIWIRHTSLSWTELLEHNDACNCTAVHTLSTAICTSVNTVHCTARLLSEVHNSELHWKGIHCQRHLHFSAQAQYSQLH